jgi:SAM-dependent methyltransferase
MSAAADAARAAYQGQSGQAYHAEKRGLPPGAFSWVIRARAERFQPAVKPGDAVLELGCGAGWNLAGLRCRRRVGFDVATQLRSELEAAGIEFTDSLRPLLDGSFEVVLCHHALEHVPEPLSLLEEARRLLRPGGVLLLAVPHETQRRYRRFRPDERNHHLFSWNPQSLGNLLRVAGFEFADIGLRRYGYDRRAAWLAHRAHAGESGYRWIRAALQRAVPLYEVTAVARPRAAAGPGPGGAAS